MPSAEGQEISTARKGAAALAMTGAGGTLAWDALRHIGVADWVVVAFAGVLVGAGALLTRKSLLAQILGRGVAWLTLVPSALAVAERLYLGRTPHFTEAMLATSTAAALALARPMLHTSEAKAAFDPRRFRRLLLAGSTATAATAVLTGGITLEMAGADHNPTGAAGFAMLTAALLATALGVIRMRAWGILLGAVTSIALLGAAAVIGGVEGVFMATLALPTLALHTLPILLARYTAGPTASPARYRVADSAARVRVELDEDLLYTDSEHLPQERREVHV